MAWQITLEVSDARWRQALPNLAPLIRAALHAVPHPSGTPSQLAVVLASDGFVAALNGRYRHQHKPTNILSFPAWAEDELVDTTTPGGEILGDLILAYETVTQEAEAAHKPLAAHLSHLLIHGLLHLLGADHHSEAEAEAMERREIALLASLGFPNPYEDPYKSEAGS
jgi:probable rRNA maturation factor